MSACVGTSHTHTHTHPVLSTVLSTLCVSALSILFQNSLNNVGSSNSPILKMRRLKHREVNNRPEITW